MTEIQVAMVLDDFFAGVIEMDAIGHALPDETVIAFELTGDGGGTWTITRSGDQVRVVRDHTEIVDCRVACTVDDFRALVRGELDGTAGFMDGRLVIEGDIGLALGLQQALQR